MWKSREFSENFNFFEKIKNWSSEKLLNGLYNLVQMRTWLKFNDSKKKPHEKRETDPNSYKIFIQQIPNSLNWPNFNPSKEYTFAWISNSDAWIVYILQTVFCSLFSYQPTVRDKLIPSISYFYFFSFWFVCSRGYDELILFFCDVPEDKQRQYRLSFFFESYHDDADDDAIDWAHKFAGFPIFFFQLQLWQ